MILRIGSIISEFQELWDLLITSVVFWPQLAGKLLSRCLLTPQQDKRELKRQKEGGAGGGGTHHNKQTHKHTTLTHKGCKSDAQSQQTDGCPASPWAVATLQKLPSSQFCWWAWHYIAWNSSLVNSGQLSPPPASCPIPGEPSTNWSVTAMKINLGLLVLDSSSSYAVIPPLYQVFPDTEKQHTKFRIKVCTVTRRLV